MLSMIVALIVLIIAGVTFFSPRHALGLMLFIFITHGIFVYILGSGAAQHLPFFSGVCVFGILLFRGKPVLPPFIAVWLFFLFISIVLVSAGVVDSNNHSMAKLVTYLKPISIAFLVACFLKSNKDLNSVATYIIASAFLGSMFNLYQKIFGNYLTQNIWDPSLSRAAGLRGDPNDTAMLLVMSLPIFYYKIISAKSYKQMFFLIMAAFATLIGIILTGSRAGFIATFIVAVLILLHNYKDKKANFVRLPNPKKIILMLILCILAANFAPGYYWERINTLKTRKEVGNSKSLDSRKYLLERGLDLWMENPIVGVGLGNFGKAFNGREVGEGQHSSNSSIGPVAHNMYLELLVETGFFGCLFFLLICWVSLVGFFRLDIISHGDNPYKFMGYGFTLSLSSMLFFGMTLSQGYNSVLWYILGMGMAAHRINKIQANSTTPLLKENLVT